MTLPTIRRATPADAEALSRIGAETFTETFSHLYPPEDLAAFLSPAMHWLYTGSCLTADQSATFLAGYPDAITRARYAALAPVLHWRIAAHCAWKARRGDADYAQALRLELHHLG